MQGPILIAPFTEPFFSGRDCFNCSFILSRISNCDCDCDWVRVVLRLLILLLVVELVEFYGHFLPVDIELVTWG